VTQVRHLPINGLTVDIVDGVSESTFMRRGGDGIDARASMHGMFIHVTFNLHLTS